MEQKWDEILKGKLFVGPAEDAEYMVKEAGVQKVFDLRVNGLEEAPFEAYAHRPILDGQEAESIQKGAKEIAAALKDDQKVYIHCGSGNGRACVMTSAVLLELGEAKSVDEAMNYVSSKRQSARFQEVMINALKSIYIK